MTLLEKWLEEGCSVENIERKIKKLLKNQRWTDLFCRDERDCYLGYCQSNNQMRKQIETYDTPYVSSVYNEEIALKIIKECIEKNANQIAVWFSEPKKTQTFIHVGNTPVGIVRMQGSQDFTPTFTTMITLKKSGYSNKNRSGFHVEEIIPIPELPI